VRFNINDQEEMAEAGTDAAMQFARYVGGVVDGALAPAGHAYFQSVLSTLVGLMVAAIGRERTLQILQKSQLIAEEIDPEGRPTRH